MNQQKKLSQKFQNRYQPVGIMKIYYTLVKEKVYFIEFKYKKRKIKKEKNIKFRS